ncbi:MAG: alpha/beta fold hydrolase [Tepidisphaeraceae bacterium]
MPRLSSLLLLPGLDGTGDLFGPLLGVLPEQIRAQVVDYPTDRLLSYDDLFDQVQRCAPRDERIVVVAESFSGPVAVRYAAKCPDRVVGLVLCASFVRTPVPQWLAPAIRGAAFRLQLPKWVLRRILLDHEAPDSLLAAVQNAIKRVSPAVLAFRAREVMRVDCASMLAGSTVPLLCLFGRRDRIVRGAGIRRIIEARPDAEVRMLDAPHLILQTRPVAAWNEIDGFLKRSL